MGFFTIDAVVLVNSPLDPPANLAYPARRVG